MNDVPDPTEADYTSAAHTALERADYRLALEQVAGALYYRPNAPELRALLDLALTRSKQPLAFLPHTGAAFFGVGAVRAAALARAGRLGEAILQLFDVVTFRPTAPFLTWIDEWRARGLRGVGVDAVAAAVARFHSAIDKEGSVAPENLAALAALLAALRAERPKAGELLLRLEAITLRQLGDSEGALRLVQLALAAEESAALLLEKGLTQRSLGDYEGAVTSLRRAYALSGAKDVSITSELADALVRAGLLDEAAQGYETLRATELEERAAGALLGLRALRAPDDAEVRGAALSAAHVPIEVALALRVGRTELPPWDDVLAYALPELIDGLRERPPPDRTVRVRLHLDRPLPLSARVLFAVAASELSVAGDLVTGDASDPLPEREPLSSEARAFIAELEAEPLNLDRWAQPGPTLALDDARRAFMAPLEGAPRTAEGFERQRLAVLSLALRDNQDPAAPALSWVLALARADDAWAARAALLALGAVGRRRHALAALVIAASRDALAFDDARKTAAHATRIHFSDLGETRGAAVCGLVRGCYEASSLSAPAQRSGTRQPR